MALCSHCGKSFLFGGVSEGGARYCDNECRDRQLYLNVAEQAPEHLVEQYIADVRTCGCPECGSKEHLDVHRSYWVWSAVLLTRWGSSAKVLCRSCGRKQLIGNTLFSLVLGWWGVPWGLIITPIQVFRNIGASVSGSKGDTSEEMRRVCKVMLGRQLVAQNQANQG